MTEQQIQKGQELITLRDQTQNALDKVQEILDRQQPPNKRDDKHFNDGCYWLSIALHKDGSGVHSDLNRYYGNKDLLLVIKKELQRQLEDFKKQIADL